MIFPGVPCKGSARSVFYRKNGADTRDRAVFCETVRRKEFVVSSLTGRRYFLLASV